MSSEYGACGERPVPGGVGSASRACSTWVRPVRAQSALVQLITSQ